MNSIKGIIYCPLCGKASLSFSVWVKTEVGDILRCGKCGLGFLHLNSKDIPAIEEVNLSAYNLKSYYRLLIRMKHELTRRYKNQLKEISRFVKEKGKLVDIGCSIGMFLNTAISFGFEPYGYDINKINLQKAKKFLTHKEKDQWQKKEEYLLF